MSASPAGGDPVRKDVARAAVPAVRIPSLRRPFAPGARALACALVSCLVTAWLVAGALVLQVQEREVAVRALYLPMAAQALRQQLDAQPGETARRSAILAASASGRVPGRPAGLPADLDWTGGVQDRHGAVIVAAPGFERLQGAPLGALALAAGSGAEHGLVRTRTGAGVPVVLAYSRLRAQDAVAVVGTTERALVGDWQRWAAPRIAAVGLALLAGTATALWLLRDLAKAQAGIARAAQRQTALRQQLQARTRERDTAQRAQAEAERESRRDPLTRLANRTAFLRRLDAAIGSRRGVGGSLTVLFVDLDDFKSVNDRWGHAVGDALLCAFATRLLGAVREGDLTARLGGDEFAVLVDGLTAQETEPIAQALLDRLSLPYGLCEQRLQVTASIGMASYPADAGDAAGLLHAADVAMFGAKAAGKGDFRCSSWGRLPSPGSAHAADAADAADGRTD
ncbi:diguanylate cyclase domain-containing protein [Rubrivivax sp. RP6-9]|uniref:diguanylate cyclase domain-containing protein n=1 Tax=Rubrivivax sp. RP6-9 TaxID=3415750 RepID=UPI003CC597AC